MVWPLLRRGLLVGVLAGLAAGAFAFVFGEPILQDAIRIEQAAPAEAALTHAADLPVSRPDQRVGLLVATALYGACMGTLFALAFALVRGRCAARDDWQLSTRLAAGLFVALVLVPFLKYPASPPGVGDPDTVGERTWVYLAMLVGGLVSLAAAARVMWTVRDDAAAWLRPVLGAGTFVVLVAFLALALPGVDEVPARFPPSLLWEFRLSSLGAQLVLWTALGTGFGIASLRAARAAAPQPSIAGPGG